MLYIKIYYIKLYIKLVQSYILTINIFITWVTNWNLKQAENASKIQKKDITGFRFQSLQLQ